MRVASMKRMSPPTGVHARPVAGGEGDTRSPRPKAGEFSFDFVFANHQRGKRVVAGFACHGRATHVGGHMASCHGNSGQNRAAGIGDAADHVRGSLRGCRRGQSAHRDHDTQKEPNALRHKKTSLSVFRSIKNVVVKWLAKNCCKLCGPGRGSDWQVEFEIAG